MSIHDAIADNDAARSAAAMLVLRWAAELPSDPAARPLLENAWTVLRQAVGAGPARQAMLDRAERDHPGQGTARAEAALALLGLDPATGQ